jgi:hypothetical protein
MAPGPEGVGASLLKFTVTARTMTGICEACATNLLCEFWAVCESIGLAPTGEAGASERGQETYFGDRWRRMKGTAKPPRGSP